MEQDKVEAFSLVIEVSMLVVALCVSIALGFMFGPGVGFLAFGGFVMLFVIVIVASFAKARKQAGGNDEAEVDL